MIDNSIKYIYVYKNIQSQGGIFVFCFSQIQIQMLYSINSPFLKFINHVYNLYLVAYLNIYIFM